MEVVTVDGDEVGDGEEEEEEETSGELGSWDHDLQEQYIRWFAKWRTSFSLWFSSEGASFESPRDVSMKEGDVLAFGEDYGDFLR